MADVTSTFSSISSTESSNNPTGATSVGTGLDDNIRMVQAHMAAWRDQTAWSILTLTSVAGTANAITATLAAAGSVTFGPTALTAGMKFLLVPASNNSAATAITITSPNGGSSLGSKNIFCAGRACVGGELVSGVPAVIEYDGTQFNILGPLDINSLTADTTPDVTADLVQSYDASASAFKKVLLGNIIKYKVGSGNFDVSSITGTFSVTGLGFKPRFVVFGQAFGSASFAQSWGFTDGTAEYTIYNNSATTAGQMIADTAKIGFHTQGGGATQAFSIVTGGSLDTDGFTVKNTKAGSPAGTIAYGYVAFR